MNAIHDILKQYWGYDTFRPLQEDIIHAVLENQDVLALLPTGGGKSLCFQVPALAKPGICIVVSPLISLMRDQVKTLHQKKIKATAIVSGMNYKEIDILLDNCIYGDYKFLYVSPERLKSEIFKVRVAKMNVNLIAVDEAHCISQWGYDFRPSYLEIASLRALLPKVPLIALTATATNKVIEDIKEKLEFKKSLSFKQSFLRENIAFIVRYEQDKFKKLKEIINKAKGSGIVYVRNRKKTEEVALLLNKFKIKSDFYHAGLSLKERDEKQKNWIENKTQVIVATNAFGMGIDKPDVRFVVHLDIPESLEAYYQEAGRAGRDQKKAFSVLICNEIDRETQETQFLENYPSKEEIKTVYQSLGNFFHLAVGSGAEQTYSFDLEAFIHHYQLKKNKVIHALKFLEQYGLIALTGDIHLPSKIKLNLEKEKLYEYQIKHSAFEPLIKALLRNYIGIFEQYTQVSEIKLSRILNRPKEEVLKQIVYLEQQGILQYLPKTELPQLTYVSERIDIQNLSILPAQYDHRKKLIYEKMQAIWNYAFDEKICRSKNILTYFDEKAEPCGTCDLCIENKIHSQEEEIIRKIQPQILEFIKAEKLDITLLLNKFSFSKRDLVMKAYRWMLDEGLIQINTQGFIQLK